MRLGITQRKSHCGLQYRRRGKWLAVWLVLMLPAAGVQASPDGWMIEGEHGVLQVSGQLTEGACRLDMRSAMQQIALGNSDTRPLRRAGDRGTPVQFRLYLRDCLQRSEVSDDDNANLLQPTVSVIFAGEADSNNPQLLALKGASGVGLRLLDADKNDLRIGTSGGSASPAFLTPDSSQLTDYVVLERTQAQLVAGVWQAVVNFRLSYD